PVIHLTRHYASATPLRVVVALAGLVCTLLLFLMLPRPTRSTLFPYTTLFRSVIAHQRGCDIILRRQRIGGAHHHGCAANPLSTQDRKSTRLNSSHQIISYAVFCLKKKKKTTKIHNAIVYDNMTE